MKLIERIVDWVLNSSADPARASLAVRGVLVFSIGFAVKVVATSCAAGFACVALDQGLLSSIADVIVNIVFWGCSIIGGIGFLVGAFRKVWRTATGQLA